MAQSNNPLRYKPSPVHKLVKFEVTVMLDAVPGPWNQPEDFLKWFFRHNYVQSAEQIVDVSETTVDDDREIPQLSEEEIKRYEEIL